MPSAGLTKIQAVNRLLRTVNELPTPVLETGGNSIIARAEEVLDESHTAMLIRGWNQENIERSSTQTPSGSPSVITLATTALRVRGAGRDYHRSFQIRGGGLFDMDAYTNVFATAVTVDIAHYVEWDDLSPAMKELITDDAAVYFQRNYRGSPEADLGQRERLLKSELLTSPWREQMPPVQMNVVPSFSASAPQRGQQQ